MDPSRRRNSILKMDSDATPTKTFASKNKRISFSGKNSVKEFGEGNDQLYTVWGPTYEKDMQAHQKSDSAVSTQMDISVSMSETNQQVIATIRQDKENVVPRQSHFSFAFLEGEYTDIRSPNQTMLHTHPTDNVSVDERRSLAPVPNNGKTDAANEVSMIWQDIISQTEKAGGFNKTASKMGSTICLSESSAFRPVVRDNENCQTIVFPTEKRQMDISATQSTMSRPSVLVSNQVRTAIPNNRQTVYYGQDKNDAELDESLFKVPQPVTRQTILFHGNEPMDESYDQNRSAKKDGTTDYAQKEEMQQPLPNTNRKSIYYDQGDMDISVLAKEVNNPPVATSGRKTVYYNENDANLDVSSHQTVFAPASQVAPAPPKIRPTIYEQGGMDISLVESVENDPIALSSTRSERKRETVYDPGCMDISILGNAPLVADDKVIRIVTRSSASKIRETVYDHGGMDISQIANNENCGHNATTNMPVRRQTIHYKDTGLDESSCPPIKYYGPEKFADKQITPRVNTRQTVYEPIGLDISVADDNATRAPPSRQTVYYQGTNTGLDESGVITNHVNISLSGTTGKEVIEKRWLRQTISELDGMDISLAPAEEEKIHTDIATGTTQVNDPEKLITPRVNTRETVYEPIALDISVADIHANRVAPRQTVYYQGTDTGLDESYVPTNQSLSVTTGKETIANPPQLRPHNTRQTVYDRGMDISLAMDAPPLPAVSSAVDVNQKNRQTIHFDANNAKLNESNVHGLTKPIMGRKSVYEHTGMDISLMDEATVHSIAPLGNDCHVPQTKNRQTVYYKDAALDVSYVTAEKREIRSDYDPDGMDKTLIVDSANCGESFVKKPVDLPPKPVTARQTIYYDQSAYVDMDESDQLTSAPLDRSDVAVLNARRGTYNVPPEESRMLIHEVKNSIVAAADSMVSDLNNLEDSIELMDSNGKACPVSRNVSQRISLMPSPDLQNETVQELVLNFNVTGQFVAAKDEAEDDVAIELGKSTVASKIPVPKIHRTPAKQVAKVSGLYDPSMVDVVCRDAGMVMQKSNFPGIGTDQMELEDMAKVGHGKMDVRYSIPAFAENPTGDNLKRQTMLGMADVTEYEPALNSDGQGEVEFVRQDITCGRISGFVGESVPEHRQLDVEKFDGLDFEDAMKQLRMLRYMVGQVCNTTPIDESLAVPKSAEYVSRFQRIMDQTKEEIERRKKLVTIEVDRGCFPLCLPMEDMIKNMVDSCHGNWRYQDLFYFMGIMKFKHRLIKTFEVVITFQKVDEAFEREHYLPFEGYQIIEEDLSKRGEIDRSMHKALLLQLPMGLASLYGTSNDLGRFLTDVDRICRRIFRETFSRGRN